MVVGGENEKRSRWRSEGIWNLHANQPDDNEAVKLGCGKKVHEHGSDH